MTKQLQELLARAYAQSIKKVVVVQGGGEPFC